ncbi:Multidrug resistance protein MdtK [Oligella sp. MSHR50489EDL]|uniref:MATE family efflux transporter n=1 Tax=Oligella sp. MSHR50489EDL TaxID=3139409 RepID=UPI003D8158E8
MEAFLREHKQLMIIAAPLVFIQLCQASLGLVDTLLAGQYHYIDLAAVGLGSAIWNAIMIFLAGTLFVLVPKFAELTQEANQQARQALYVVATRSAIVLAIVGFVLVHLAAFLIGYFISDVAVAAIAKNYLHCVAFGLPALVFFAKLRYMGEGHKRLVILMTISALSLLINFLLSYCFVFGGFGIPAMGGVGCGVGTALSGYIAVFILYFMMKRALPEVVGNKQQRASIQVGSTQVKKLLLEGLPIGFALVLQILALALIAFAAEGLGVKHIGAHQIMITIAMCLVMIPLAIGNASTIQIAGYLSTHDKEAVRYVIASALVTLILYGAVIVGLVLLAYSQLISLFTSDSQIIQLALSSVVAFTLFLVFDSVQMMFAGMLRGFQDFVRPLIAVLLAYWVVIIPTLFVLSRWWIPIQSVAAIWHVMTVGLFGTAVYLIFVLYRKINELRNDELF